MRDAIINILTSEFLTGFWIGALGISLVIVIYDLNSNNKHLMPLMKWVWVLTILYSGPIGLAIYYKTGRKEISTDNIWRKSWRSVAHCYSGCGAGEVAGIIIAAGLLSLTNIWVAATTFALAYVAGFALTIGPLMQEGEDFKTAFKDAFWSETASITVMEVTAIGLDLWLAADAQMNEQLFWSSLIFSLSIGLFAAYPVNVLLIKLGLKEGMHDPRHVH